MELALAGRLLAACIAVALVLVAVAAISRMLVRGRAPAPPSSATVADAPELPGTPARAARRREPRV